MNPSKLMEAGYAFPCACCFKLHRAIGRGLEFCEHAKDEACGGPFLGKAFPLYEGPLTRQMIASRCFRCGKESDYLAELPRKVGFLGVCEEHKEMLRPKSPQALIPGNLLPEDYSF